MTEDLPPGMLAEGLRVTRSLALVMGGYAVEVPGATMVVNEKVPVPRFNWVQDVQQSPGRVLAFVERALEHYYQRALRPTFDLRAGVSQDLLVRCLGEAHYRSRGPTGRRHLLLRGAAEPPPGRPPSTLEARVAEEEDLDSVVDFLAEGRFREEVWRSLEVVIAHPNPGERFVPYLGWDEGKPVAVGLLHHTAGAAGLHALASLPEARGRGHATSLLNAILRDLSPPARLWMTLEGESVARPVREMGFETVASFEVFELDETHARKGV